MTENVTAANRLRVLYVTEFLPWPLTHGGAIRSYNIFRELCRYHDVTVVCQVGEEQAADVERFESLATRVVRLPLAVRSKWSKALGALTTLASSRPYVSAYSHYQPAFARSIEALLAAEKFDVVHIDHLDAAVYADLAWGRVPVFVDNHNFETALLRSAREKTSNALLRGYLGSQVKKLERFEKLVLEKASGSAVVSELDGDKIRDEFGIEKPAVIPNGVDLEAYDIERRPEAGNVVTIGSLDWLPNVEGVAWFLDEVWELARSSSGSLEKPLHFHVVGRNPPARLEKRACDHITVWGTVPDVREYAQRAQVFVVPLLAGGGTRLKVLEALAMRVPMVATSKAVEGIDVVHGEHCLIHDDAEGFARSVVELAGNPQRAEALAAKGRQLVEDRYGWEAIGRLLQQSYALLRSEKVGESA